ncbi:MAG: hypothetical protein ABGZ17_07290 [Planctomycetaceae bacterium]
MATVSPWFQTAQLLAKIRKRFTIRSEDASSGGSHNSEDDSQRPSKKNKHGRSQRVQP